MYVSVAVAVERRQLSSVQGKFLTLCTFAEQILSYSAWDATRRRGVNVTYPIRYDCRPLQSGGPI